MFSYHVEAKPILCAMDAKTSHIASFFYPFVVIKTMQNVGIEWIVNKTIDGGCSWLKYGKFYYGWKCNALEPWEG